MKYIRFSVWLLALWLAWPIVLYAQSSTPIVFHSGATENGNGEEVSAAYFSTMAVHIEGTFTGTVFFEKKTKDAQGWAAVQCVNASDRSQSATQATEPGYWDCPGGSYLFRARVEHDSGTIIVTGHGSIAVTRSGGSGGGGSGTVTSVSASGGVETASGSPITGSGTIRGNTCVRKVESTTATIVADDRGCLILFEHADPITVTIAEAGTTGFDAGYAVSVRNIGAGEVTITPEASEIDGNPELTLSTNTSTRIISDGIHYVLERLPIIVAPTPSLAQVSEVGRSVTNATDANPMSFGNGTTQIELGVSDEDGAFIRTNPPSNVRTRIPSGLNYCIQTLPSGDCMLTVTPGASTPREIYAFQPGYYLLKSIWFGAGALDGDGTHCPALATTVQLNSGPRVPTIICANNNGSSLDSSIPMPPDWSGGAITFRHHYIQTAADTNALEGDIKCQVRSPGEAPSSTWGTPVTITDAAVSGSNQEDATTSASVTCAGTTPAGGDVLYFRYTLHATETTTATATLHHKGFWLTYPSTSWSH